MKSTQAEILLRIAENTFADSDDVLADLAELRQKLMAQGRRILDDEELLIQAWEINQKDKARFVQYMPIVQQAQGQAALGSTLQQQRATLGSAQNRVAKLEGQQRATFEKKVENGQT